MKKTLLIAAAALAAGVISTQAQPVYSQNIVGYVNVPAAPGFTAMANPLTSGNNSATNFFDTTSGAQDGNLVLQWTGTKYSQIQVDSGSPTGFSDPNTAATLPAPVLSPGVGFFLNNQNSSNTVTFVGDVAASGGTGSIGNTTNSLPSSPNLSFVGSIMPVAGGVTAALQISNPGGAIDGCLVLVPTVVGGQIKGYSQVQFDSGSATGFSDPNTAAQKPEPQIGVGQSFFFNNQSGAPISWVQSL